MANNEIIQVEQLSKRYKLGEINTGTLSHDLNRWWHKLRGKQDPFDVFQTGNELTGKTSDSYVWSLKDVNFSVQSGEIFGIIGKNGAGKSTLLKLLSKITSPTSGCIKLDGRVASLLEVGTGFHPDLSGRENVFLNGAILGMQKHEIKSRFDEIVDFSGIEKYIDTPVKRYSSGMFVRLAFAVAAHLEPEILIIDEVLAVGDAEFQQKCIGKMQDVANKKGRTILFVSHNNTAIKRLCTKAMLLEKGTVKLIDTPEKILEAYQVTMSDPEHGKRNTAHEQTDGYFTEWKIEDNRLDNEFSCYCRDDIMLTTKFRSVKEIQHCVFHLMLKDDDDNIILHASSKDFNGQEFNLHKGDFRFNLRFALPLKHGNYKVELGLTSGKTIIDYWKTTTKLAVLDTFDHEHLNLEGILNIETSFTQQPISFLISSF